MKSDMVIGALCAALLVCAVPASAQSDPATVAPPVASTTLPAPAADKAQMIFFRKGGFVGGGISCAVHEKGAKLTSLPPGHYAVVDVDPGAHDFTVQSEATSTLHVDAQAGQTYYGVCTVGMGVMAGHPHLRVSDPATFTAMQANLKPVVKHD